MESTINAMKLDIALDLYKNINFSLASSFEDLKPDLITYALRFYCLQSNDFWFPIYELLFELFNF